MAAMEAAALAAPVSADDPCGPDLDLEGDADYLNFFARAEGMLPASYFSSRDGKPFDRGTVDFPATFEAAAPLLERTRDIRLLTLAARLRLLDRDIAGFQACVEAVAAMLQERWEEVHPRAEDGDFTLRMTAIETLDDAPTVVLPMQFIPLAMHRRHGPIIYRAFMIASGEARPREDEEEEQLDLGALDRALMEVDLPPLIETLNRFDAIQSALARMRSAWIEHAGFDLAVNLEKSSQLAAKIVALLNGIVAKREPSAALSSQAAPAAEKHADETPSAGAAAATGPISSAGEVTAALAAAADYFARSEPSNPALLLVRQAQQLVGLTFIDAMRVLVPNYMDQAVIAIGGNEVFDLPIERLSAFSDAGNGAASEADAGGWDAPPADEETDAANAQTAGDDPGGESEETSEAEAAAAPPSAATQTSSAAPARPPPNARTRNQALALLDQVAIYYRATEPTSPVPLLTERARRLAERDFMSLLKDFLPDSTLRSLKTPS